MRLYCLLLVASCLCQVRGQSFSCSGAFDFIFVIDSSASLGEQYNESVIPFVESISNNFINPDFRLCFITFDTPPAVVHLPLTPTEDREAVSAAIESMRKVELDYGTDLPRALDVAIDQIKTNGGESVRVLLAITDGTWVGIISHRVEELERLDVQRFAIGIGSIDEDQLLTFVDNKQHLFIGSNFQYLQEIIDLVINRTCVEVTSINPRKLCMERNKTDIVLLGRGFTINLNTDKAGCRFRDGSEYIVTQPVGDISKHRMVCEDPGITTTGEVELQVTLDGEAYITSNIKVVISDCKEEEGGGGGEGEIGGGGGGGGGGGKEVDVGLVVGVLLGLLALVVLILLCCLWLCFPLFTCKIVGGLPPEPEEKEPEPKPGRKWEIVDASYYGGGGIGGIKPVTVRWGKGGSTEEGNRLTKAKDAEVVEVVEEPGVPAPPPKAPPGCWERFKRKVKRMYAVASSYRPVWGPTKRILWFPGTKPDQTASQVHKNGPSKPSHAPLRTGSSSAFLLPDGGNVTSPVRPAPPPTSSTRAPPPTPSPSAPPPPPTAFPASRSSGRAPPPPPQHTSSSLASRSSGRAPPPPPQHTSSSPALRSSGRAPPPRPPPLSKPHPPSNL